MKCFSNLLQRNLAPRWGAGSIDKYATKIFHVNNTYIDNTAKIGGGLAFAASTIAHISNCLFQENNGEYGEAGIYIRSVDHICASKNTFIRNRANQGGGGYVNEATHFKIQTSKFVSNEVHGNGGGTSIYCNQQT